MEYRTCLIMMKSELRNGAGAYEMGNAVSARSGPSFGPFQYDVGSNQDGRNLLESIAANAVDARGHRILSDQQLQSVKDHFYKPFADFTPADSALYDQLKPKLNAALGSEAGVKAIDADFVPKVRQKIDAVNAIVAGMAEGPNKDFISNSDVARLILIDTKNQYGDAVNDGLRRFIALTDADAAMDMPGRDHGTTIKVEGAFGLDDMVRYKLETQYGQTDRGAKDVLRRIAHCVEAAGIQNAKAGLSREDKEFFRSGLEMYLRDRGHDTKMLDAAELKPLAELGDRTPALKSGNKGPRVVDLQRELAALGYRRHGRLLKGDGDFGPATRDAVEDFQRRHGLEPDGIVGRETAEAMKHATLQLSALRAMTLDDPQHPGFTLFRQAFMGVGRLDRMHGRATDLATYNLSGAVALGARKAGLEKIDQVVLSDDGTRVIAVQGDMRSPLRRLASVDVVTGVNTSLAQSSTDWSQFQVSETHLSAPPPVHTADVKAVPLILQR
jgi:hypothetical protein